MLKSQLRKAFLKKRQQLDAHTIQANSLKICEQLQNHPAWQQAKTIAAYMPFAGEVDLRSLFHNTDKTFAIPKIDLHLEFYKFENFENLQPNPLFQFLEPAKNAEPIAATQFDLLLIPLIAFNTQGYRLGFGKGYYDRFFQSTPCQGLKIGLAYSWQQADFPIDSWDVPLDLILTETGWSNTHDPNPTKS